MSEWGGNEENKVEKLLTLHYHSTLSTLSHSSDNEQADFAQKRGGV